MTEAGPVGTGNGIARMRDAIVDLHAEVVALKDTDPETIQKLNRELEHLGAILNSAEEDLPAPDSAAHFPQACDSALANFVKFRSSGTPNLASFWELVNDIALLMRKSDRETRYLEMRNQVAKARESAKKTLDAAQKHFESALTGGAINIGGGALSTANAARGLKVSTSASNETGLAAEANIQADAKRFDARQAARLTEKERGERVEDAVVAVKAAENQVLDCERRLQAARTAGPRDSAAITAAERDRERADVQLAHKRKELEHVVAQLRTPIELRVEADSYSRQAANHQGLARDLDGQAAACQGYSYAINSFAGAISQISASAIELSAAEDTQKAANLQAEEKKHAVAEDIYRESAQSLSALVDKVLNTLTSMKASAIEAQKHAIQG